MALIKWIDANTNWKDLEQIWSLVQEVVAEQNHGVDDHVLERKQA